MIITRDKEYKEMFVVYSVCAAGILGCFIFGLNKSFVFVLLLIPVYFFMALYLISYGRTFVLNEYGCTVHFWKYKKLYTWDQLKTKRIEKYNSRPLINGTYRGYYLTEAIFCFRKIRKPKFIRPSTYSIIHPFSCIYINFNPTPENWKRGRHYEVDEMEFREKMKQWGVELEER